MAKLGEAKLGSTKFAEPASLEVSSEIEEEVRERAEETIKSVFPTGEGTNWDKILKVVLEEFKREHEIIRDIVENRFIDDASGEQLDMIGEMWQVERRPQESDDHLRARIKLQLPRHTSTGTLDMMVDVTATILETRPERVQSVERFDVEPARFDLHVEEIVTHDAPVEIEEAEELIQDVKPGGVKAVLTLDNQFTYRSEDDWLDGENDENKGYGGYDYDTVDEWPTFTPDDPANHDITITVEDEDGDPDDTATVELGDYDSDEPDPDGEHTIPSVDEGVHDVTIEGGDKTSQKTIEVTEDDTEFTLTHDGDDDRWDIRRWWEEIDEPIQIEDDDDAEYDDDIGGPYADEITAEF